MKILDPKEAALQRYDDMNDRAHEKIYDFCRANHIFEENAESLIAAMISCEFDSLTSDDILLGYNALHGPRNDIEEAYYKIFSGLYSLYMERKVFDDEDDEDSDIVSFN